MSLRPEVCRSIGEVEVPMLNVALSHVRAPKVISGCRLYDKSLRWARIFRLNRRLKILGSNRRRPFQTHIWHYYLQLIKWVSHHAVRLKSLHLWGKSNGVFVSCTCIWKLNKRKYSSHSLCCKIRKKLTLWNSASMVQSELKFSDKLNCISALLLHAALSELSTSD